MKVSIHHEFPNTVNWNKLFEESATSSFFQNIKWSKLWVKHFAKKDKIRIFEVRNGNELIGVAPLIKKDNGYHIIGTPAVLGDEFVTDYGDIIAKAGYEDKVWRSVIDKIKNINSDAKILLNFLRDKSPSYEILKKIGGKAEQVDVTLYIDLPETWDEYLMSLTRKNRHELRRKIRRLEKEGEFTISGKEENNNIGDFFSLMSKSSELKAGFLTEKMQVFFKDIVDYFSKKDMLKLCFLKLKDKKIAGIMAFIFRNKILLYNSGFDPDYYKLSPGFLLNAFMIRQAIKDKRKKFDFLRGSERYKYDFGGKEIKLFKIIL